MPAALFDVAWQQISVVAILIVILWTGHKGWWYWSPGVRALTTELARERDDWRALAVTLLRKEGIDLPTGYETAQSILLPGEDDRWTKATDRQR
jgi:hypothetical protein